MISNLVFMKKIAIALLATLVLFFSITGVPQDKPQDKPQTKNQPAKDEPFKFSVGSNIVLVPVIVTDKQGNHVPGLTTDDFEVKENNTVEKIARFNEITSDVAKVQKMAWTPNTFTNEVNVDQPKKLEIIVLDQVNTPFQYASDGHRMLIEFLAKNVDANTLLALVAFQNNGVRIIHDFTSDPAVLVEAVKKTQVAINSRDSQAFDALGDNTQTDLEALQITALLNGADLGPTSDPGQLLAEVKAIRQQQRARVDQSMQAQEGLITLEDFQQVAQYFGHVPGRKSLIWASTGFPFALGTAPQSSTRGTLFEDWERTFHMLEDANISVYPVDIGGLVPGSNANVRSALQNQNDAALRSSGVAARSDMMNKVDSGAFIDPNQNRHDSMHQLADMTGGEAFYNSNDGAELFRRAGQDAAQYYMLAYYTKDDGKYGWRKLSVKVRKDGVKVRTRSGFFFTDKRKDADPNGILKELKMAMTSDLSFTSVPIRGQWQQVEPAGAQKKVHFMLSIPAGVASIDTENQNHISLEFLVAATDSSGKPQGNISQRFDTKLPPEGVDQIQAKGLDYASALTLAPGKYKVHFVVRDNLKRTLGSIVVPLEVK